MMDVLQLIYDKVCQIEKDGNANTKAIASIDARMSALEGKAAPGRSLHPVASMAIGAVITVIAGPLVMLVARAITDPSKPGGDPGRLATDMPVTPPDRRQQYQTRGP